MILEKELKQMYKNRFHVPYPKITEKMINENGVIVYGLASQGEFIVMRLLQHGIKPSWIVDKSEHLHGSRFCGIEVLPVSSLKSAGNRFVILGSTHVREMATQCESCGVQNWILPAATCDFCIINDFGVCSIVNYNLHINELTEVFNLLADDKSKKIFLAYLNWHFTFDNDFSALRDSVNYFPDDLKNLIDYSCFIDNGAYIGDTLSDWLKYYEHRKDETVSYYAIEPDKDTFNKLRDYVQVLNEDVKANIHLINCATGASEGFVNIVGQNGSSIIQNTDTDTGLKCCTIDNLFASECPTIIKADVEGTEMDLLRGAEKTIRRCKPTLAISVYHKFYDLWEIPKWIDNLDCGYKIYLRHYPKVFTDTTCYAIAD